jgi:hypothetical protein
VEQRYLFAIGPLMNALREGPWRWADGGKTKAALDEAFAAIVGARGVVSPCGWSGGDARHRAVRGAVVCEGEVMASHDALLFLFSAGPRTAEDDAREAEAKEARKTASKAKAKEEKAAAAAVPAPSNGGEGAGAVRAADSVETAFSARELKAALNTPELLEAHRAVSVGKACEGVCVRVSAANAATWLSTHELRCVLSLPSFGRSPRARSGRASRRSPTASCTSVTPSP